MTILVLLSYVMYVVWQLSGGSIWTHEVVDADVVGIKDPGI